SSAEEASHDHGRLRECLARRHGGRGRVGKRLLAPPGLHESIHGGGAISVRGAPPDCHRLEEAMKCPQCNGAELEVRRQNHSYRESGLDNIVLLDVDVRHCPACGEDLISLPRLSELHRAIALALINKAARLTPAEIRYLRKTLGWSGTDFA